MTISPYPELKRDPTRSLVREVAALERFTLGGIKDAVARLRGGDTIDEFEEAMLEHLQEAHTRGVVLGRRWAGDRSPRELDDELFAGRQVERELAYLAKFVADIRAGRYDDEAGGFTTGLDARANLYGHKVGGTVSEAFVLASPSDDRFTWIMLADEHCDDCPRIAAGSPYAASALPTYPRAGATACRVNCKCVLVRQSDGMPSPPPFGL